VNQVARGISTTQIRYAIPTITWLRLRWLCRRQGLEMSTAVCGGLKRALDAEGVPTDPAELLKENGRVDAGRGRK